MYLFKDRDLWVLREAVENVGSSIGFSGKLPRLKFWTLTTSCDISSRMASLLGFKVPISNMEVTKVPQSMVGRTKRDNAQVRALFLFIIMMIVMIIIIFITDDFL